MAEKNGTRALVWDLPVRLMHWGLVLAVAGAWATQEIEGDWFRFHVWCGYTVLVIAATRIVWGFVGTRHARFASFVRGPGAVLGYLRSFSGREAPHYAGHNPLGALMVLALLGLLLGQAITGLFANDQVMASGPLYGYVTSATSDKLTSVHKKLFDLLLVAVSLHVAAAFFYLLFKRENLIRPMVIGTKPGDAIPPEERIANSRAGLWALIVAALGALLWLVIRAAPDSSLF